ncbi:MAG TPA: RICIN domain-containing protein [Verrucomicrobiae bacterium]|jgi:hypothetical protein|nr:RICIN domain-containing protein [Verrucomicrobiae bacterium]
MKKDGKTLHHLRGAWCIVTSAMVMLLSGQVASAFTADNRDTAWNSWISQFYYTVGTNGYFRAQQGTGTADWGWQFAEEIEAVEDRSDIDMIPGLCATFVAQAGTDWSGDPYNDDLCWYSMAFSRAYMLTGNTTYKTLAKNGFDAAYNRGWDTVNGGLWWTTGKTNKCMCAEGPACVAAYLIYQTTGDANYKTKSQNIYNWVVANWYNATSGAVNGGGDAGDQGMFAEGAYFLGDTTRATKAGDFVKNTWGVSLQPTWPGWSRGGGNGICMRGLAKSGYNTTYLRQVCDNAFSRTNNVGLANPDFTTNTDNTFNKYVWDCSSMVVALLVTPTTPQIANGRYEIAGTTTGNCLDDLNTGSTNGTPIQLWGYWGGNGQLWTVTDLGNGYYSIISVNGGRSLDCSNNNFTDGAALQLWDYWAGNGQQWVITPTGSGSYKVAPRGTKSDGTHDVLDGTGCSGAAGTRVELWGWNGGCQQKWNFIAR